MNKWNVLLNLLKPLSKDCYVRNRENFGAFEKAE